MSKVLLLRPPFLVKMMSLSMPAAPPLGLSFIAGSLKSAGYDVAVLDCIGERVEQYNYFNEELVTNGFSDDEILERIPPDVSIVGISCMFSKDWMYNRVIINKIAERFPHIKIIAGGD